MSCLLQYNKNLKISGFNVYTTDIKYDKINVISFCDYVSGFEMRVCTSLMTSSLGKSIGKSNFPEPC